MERLSVSSHTKELCAPALLNPGVRSSACSLDSRIFSDKEWLSGRIENMESRQMCCSTWSCIDKTWVLGNLPNREHKNPRKIVADSCVEMRVYLYHAEEIRGCQEFPLTRNPCSVWVRTDKQATSPGKHHVSVTMVTALILPHSGRYESPGISHSQGEDQRRLSQAWPSEPAHQWTLPDLDRFTRDELTSS